MSRELAGENGPGLVELFDCRRVGSGDCVETDSRMAGRPDARGRIDILQSEGDAVHRSTVIARCDLSLGLACLIQSALGGQQQVCIQLRVNRLRPPDQRGRQLDRRELLLLDQPRDFGDCQKS